MNEDDWARGLLADPGIGTEPPSKVDARLAVRKGRQRLWMRRSTIAVAAGGAAVLAVSAVPLLAPASSTSTTSTSPPVAQTSGFPSAEVPKLDRGQPPPAPIACVREALEMPARAALGYVYGGEPSGRYAVGLAYVDDEEVPVLWDGTRPIVLGKPKPGSVIAMAVNSSGIVVMTIQNETGRLSWIHRDGRFTELAGGYSAVAINTRGDVAGAWLDNAGVHPPAIWPAGQTSNPRVLTGGDPGDDIVAAVGGIDDDGTLVGTTAHMGRYDNLTPPPRESGSRPVYWPAGGGPARELPTPPGFGRDGWVVSIRFGMAAGNMARIDPDKDRRGNRAVVWDLAAGTVTLDDRLSGAQGVTPHGWVVGRSSAQPPAPPVAVFAGNVLNLPMPGVPAPDSGGGISISDDGRTIVGSALDKGSLKPVRWTCT